MTPFHFGAQADLQLNKAGDFGIGARAEYGLTTLIPSVPQLRAIGSFDYYFPSAGTVWQINANVAYQFPMAASPVKPYAGGGLNYTHASFGGVSASKAGLNLLGGVQFRAMGKFTPFVEARAELRSGGAFVVTGGVLLN